VKDIGIDVPVAKFVEEIREFKPAVVGLSGFLTLAFDSMKETVQAIEATGLRNEMKIMIGGGQVDEAVRTYTGADAYGSNGGHGLALDDIIIDVSISALIADTAGMNREALAAIGLIGADPELKGLHISGGLSNIAQQLPPKAADGSDLKLQLECAFLTLARPLGMDTVLATPWRAFRMLPEDNYVLGVFKQVLQASGTDVLRQVRKLYRK